MVRVKICGITSQEDAFKALELGAWALGFIFHKKSPRYISPSKARKIIQSLPPFVTPVGVFVDPAFGAIRDVIEFCRLPVVQLHGDEKPDFCRRLKDVQIIKAFRVREDFKFQHETEGFGNVSAFLFDAHDPDAFGGTGKSFNWDLLGDKRKQIKVPFILSGGLNSENVSEAISRLQPYAVDVSSGVENSPGVKNYLKIQAFIDAVNRSQGLGKS